MSELVPYLKKLKTHEVDYLEKSTILCLTPSGDQFSKQGPKILVQIFARKSHFWPIAMLGPDYPHLDRALILSEPNSDKSQAHVLSVNLTDIRFG